jgi:two-component sensor histidine kinase
VQSIARQTAQNSTSLGQFSETFDARLLALSDTHNLLTLGGWQSASLRDLILIELAPYNMDDNRRVELTGEDVQLNSRQTLALGLTIHELATNAAKYGSLSVPDGKVNVTWDVATLNDKRTLQLGWIESGGPVVKEPGVRGFGSKLIEHSLKGELGADVQLHFAPEGVRFSLSLPLDLSKA